jgi:hypothetical protein
MQREIFTEIQLDTPRRLRLDARDLYSLEKRAGITMAELVDRERTRGATLAILAQALRRDEPTLTDDAVEALVLELPGDTPFEQVFYLEDKINELVASCFPEATKKKLLEASRGVREEARKKLLGTGGSTSGSDSAPA